MDQNTDHPEKEEADDATNVWDAGGPPPPPDPDVVVHDISCQGTVAIALHEALEELQQSATLKALKEKYDFQFDRDAVMLAYGESIAELQHCQYEAQIDEAMKHQHQHQHHPQQHRNRANNNHTEANDDLDSSVPPAAVLRGRINQYNRFGTKWRIVVDDAELMISPPIGLPPKRSTKKRDRRTMSSWSLMTQPPQPESTSNANNNMNALSTDETTIKIPRLEILVYNDVE